MRERISVAMAACNGEKYIAEQIESILIQLESNDELVISYNQSNDTTYNIITEYSNTDNRIKVYECKEKGVLPNFENAIKKCTNPIIFLSDQDDIWNENKIKKILNIFLKNQVDAVAHSSRLVDETLIPECSKIDTKKIKLVHPLEIIKKNYIQGCCLAFRKQYVDLIIPFPDRIPMHDSWIAVLIASFGKLLYLDESLVDYRQHANNVTSRKHQDIVKMIKDRLILMIETKKRISKLKRGMK